MNDVTFTRSTSELHVYLERELESKKWSQLCVNRADKKNRKGLELTSYSSFNFRHLGKECAEISYFDIDLKDNGNKKFYYPNTKKRLKLSLKFYYRFFVSSLTLEIFWLKAMSCPPSWINS